MSKITQAITDLESAFGTELFTARNRFLRPLNFRRSLSVIDFVDWDARETLKFQSAIESDPALRITRRSTRKTARIDGWEGWGKNDRLLC